MADQISFVLGEASDFEAEYGYYAQGVTTRTPTFAPRDWMLRTIPIGVEQIVGRCMDPDALVLSKLGAGREKDLAFGRSVAKLGLVQRDRLIERLVLVECSEVHRKLIASRIDALFT